MTGLDSKQAMMNPADQPLQVVAAVLRDRSGRVLLAQRPEGRMHAGLWEFPGGKIEVGESVQQALVRELREELGIDVVTSEHLINVPYAYGRQRIVLHVQAVQDWQGAPIGREGQSLAWVAPAWLDDYPMPEADLPVKAALTQPACYVISADTAPEQCARALAVVLDAGVRRVQLRWSTVSARAARDAVEQASALCQAHGADLLLNSALPDALDLAQSHDCGLHLTAVHMMAMKTRPAGLRGLLAASCHTAEELRQAQHVGCDFAVLGPVKATRSHPDASPLGWEGFAKLREQVWLPIYALGGMRDEDLATARRHGAQGGAGISGFWPAAE